MSTAINVVQVPVGELVDGKNEDFISMSAFDYLCDVVRASGVASPLIVRKKGQVVVSGGKFLRAARRVGLATVPAIIVDL